MKKVFIYLFISFFLASCGMMPKPAPEQYTSTIVSGLLDVTDKRSYWPSPDQMLQYFHCKQTPNTECIFRLRAITDKKLNPIVTYRLADASDMEKDNHTEDRQFRKRNILAFYSAVRRGMNDFYTIVDTTQSLENSECFAAIAGELSYLASCNSDEKILLVASDLMEKSDIANFYTTDLTTPKQIAEQLDRTNLLPKNLSGVTVIFLFNPRDRNEDQKFNVFSEAYQLLLQAKGAGVKIQATL